MDVISQNYIFYGGNASVFRFVWILLLFLPWFLFLIIECKHEKVVWNFLFLGDCGLGADGFVCTVLVWREALGAGLAEYERQGWRAGAATGWYLYARDPCVPSGFGQSYGAYHSCLSRRRLFIYSPWTWRLRLGALFQWDGYRIRRVEVSFAFRTSGSSGQRRARGYTRDTAACGGMAD